MCCHSRSTVRGEARTPPQGTLARLYAGMGFRLYELTQFFYARCPVTARGNAVVPPIGSLSPFSPRAPWESALCNPPPTHGGAGHCTNYRSSPGQSTRELGGGRGPSLKNIRGVFLTRAKGGVGGIGKGWRIDREEYFMYTPILTPFPLPHPSPPIISGLAWP